MRLPTAAALTLALLFSAATTTNAATTNPVGTVRILSPMSGAPSPPGRGVLVSDFSPGLGSPVGEPYYAAELLVGIRGENVQSALGSSAQPMQPSVDPASGSRRTITWSACPGATDTRGLPVCTLKQIAHTGVGAAPLAPGDTPAGRADRLPSTYRGATAFVRTRANGTAGRLRFLERGATRSTALRSGPLGADRTLAGPTGIALRARTLAAVWRWSPTTASTRYAVQLQQVGGSVRTIFSVAGSRGRILGPVWSRSALFFAVRQAGGSKTTLYRYDPAHRRLSTAPGPASVGSFGIAGTQLYWTQATNPQIASGVCVNCRVYERGLPRFRVKPGGKARITSVRVKRKTSKIRVAMKCPAGGPTCKSIVAGGRGSHGRVLATSTIMMTVGVGKTSARNLKLNCASHRAIRKRTTKFRVVAIRPGGSLSRRSTTTRVPHHHKSHK